jgi:hypothetical protein
MRLPDPVIQEHEGFLVVRDDLIAGGTKRRVLGNMLKSSRAREFVYPSTAYGYGPLAVAYAAADLGRSARLFYPKRDKANWTPLMHEAVAQGAKIIPVVSGYMVVLECRAREYCERHPEAQLLPLGFDTNDFHNRLVDVIRTLPVKPREVWCAAGTGALTRSLQAAWPEADHHAVIIARKNANTGNATQHNVQYKFEQAAKNLPPFPSAHNYDAKVWDVMKRNARPGALFWNVGG